MTGELDQELKKVAMARENENIAVKIGFERAREQESALKY